MHAARAGPGADGEKAPGPPATSSPDAAAAGTAALLASSPFFDADWYAESAGCDHRPLAAARHYLRRGAARGLQPHPLFVAEHAVAACPALGEGATALETYIRQRCFEVPTHPLFDIERYQEQNPAARTHPHGPLGHYLQVGAAEGRTPNAWYRPDPREPRGLVDWVVARQREWAARRSSALRLRTRQPPVADLGVEVEPTPAQPVVSVVVEAGGDWEALEGTVRSVVHQDLPPHEILVVTRCVVGGLERRLREAFPAAPLQVVHDGGVRASTGLNLAARRATGDYLAWALPGETWAPGRLRLLQSTCLAEAVSAVCDTLRVVRPGRPDAYASGAPQPGQATSPVPVELSRLMVSRDAFEETGGFDEQLPGAWEADFSFRLAHRLRVRSVPVVGATRRPEAPGAGATVTSADEPVLDHTRVATWADAAFNRSSVDWASLGRRQQRADLVTVVITSTGAWRQTVACVRHVLAAGTPAGWSVECLVVDDGCDSLGSLMLSSLEARFEGVRVLHLPTALGPALSTNLALPEVDGSVVALVGSDVRVQRRWLDPVVEALARPDVRAVQSLVTSPSGSIHSAGFAFPSRGGLPYDFLQGFPTADAAGLDDVPVSALSRAALAVRYDDLVAVHGFDPLFRGGLEDADLCLRLQEVRGGRCVVAPGSRATQLRPRRGAGASVPVLNRRLFLDRWGTRGPRDDTRLWASRGFDVHSYVTAETEGVDRRLCAPRPVVSRPRVSVHEATPRLRWALKVASPAGDRREFWGDTHFARSLAGALRDLGQQVVIDHREDFARPSGHLDDVVLVLRGLEAFQPAYGQVNLAWVISHPELFSRREAASYDRVLAASWSWAAKMSQRWSLRIDPLLQATDPGLFHPDRGRTDAGEPLVFVGGSRRHYREIVKHSVVSGLPLSVYGSDWEDLIPRHLIKGSFVPNRDLGALYASAHVVLNDHWEDMRREGFLSNRLFDAVASGARVISDDVAGLQGMFDNSVQVATDASSLARLVQDDPLDRTFGSAEERRDVARRVHREHSFDIRARRLLDIALEVRQQQLGRR